MCIMEAFCANNTLRAAITLQACSDAAVIKAELPAEDTQVGVDSFGVYLLLVRAACLHTAVHKSQVSCPACSG